jgi:Family of unknown function (DUF6152)
VRVSLPGVLAAVFVIAAVVPTFAHHGFGVEFNKDDCRDVKGNLAALSWENPHAYFDVIEKDAGGKDVTWHLEMVTPNALKRNGTTRQDFEANMGKHINARMCRSLNKTETRGAAEYIQLLDGTIRMVGQQVERRTPEQRTF